MKLMATYTCNRNNTPSTSVWFVFLGYDCGIVDISDDIYKSIIKLVDNELLRKPENFTRREK